MSETENKNQREGESAPVDRVFMTPHKLRDAETDLAGIAALARKAHNAASVVADKAGYVLVRRERLAALENLAKSLEEADKTAAMTRDYKDVIERGDVSYCGKKYLLGRDEYNRVREAADRVRSS